MISNCTLFTSLSYAKSQWFNHGIIEQALNQMKNGSTYLIKHDVVLVWSTFNQGRVEVGSLQRTEVVAMNTHIMFALVGVGTLLVTAGTVRIVMTMFGYKLIPAWENTFRVKLSKIEFGLETKNLGIAACFVGIFVIGTPPFLLHYWGPVAELNAQESNLPVTEAQELHGYTVAEETVWIDLTKRKELCDWDRVAGAFSPVKWSSRLVVKTVEPGAEDISLRHATSGAGIRPLALPSGAQWEKSSESRGQDLYNPFVDVLKGTSLFKKLFDLNGTMRTYFMTIPVQQRTNQEIWYQLSWLVLC